jgi:hypothetical protein
MTGNDTPLKVLAARLADERTAAVQHASPENGPSTQP